MQRILRKIGQNTGTVLLTNLIGSLVGFLLAAALGRGLGDAGFGQYSLVMTWLFSLILFTEFGLSTVLTRDLAAQPAQTHHYLINSLVGKSLLALPVALGLIIFAPLLATGQNPVVTAALRWSVFPLYTGLIFSSFTAVFKAHQVMTPLLWLTLAGQITLFGGTLGLLWAEYPLFSLIAWTGVSQLLQCGLAWYLYHRYRLNAGQRQGGVEGTLLKLLLKRAWPFALAGFLAAFQLRVNILLLAYLQGDQALGWYAAANRFVETGKQLPGAFYTAILPAMAAMAGDISQNHTLQKTLRQASLTLLAFSFLAATGALFLAGPVMTLTYGAIYRPASVILQILTLTLIPNSQNSLLILYLYAQGDEKFVNLLLAAGIVINLGLCLWLIPKWGPMGTAVALLIAESALYWPYRQRVAYQRALLHNLLEKPGFSS
jgi:O-antigen/teichoic acid export membrane protein